MLHHPDLCQRNRFNHDEIIRDVSESQYLEDKQRKYIRLNPPTNTDIVPPDEIELNPKITHSRNTKCLRCSQTGVLSLKQAIFQAAGSIISYDPEKYQICDRNCN